MRRERPGQSGSPTGQISSSDGGEAEAGIGADALDEAGGLACASARGEVVFGFAARFFEDLQVADEVADAECWDAGLARAHDFAGAAYLQILFGDAEAVVGLGHDAETLLRHAGLSVRRHQNTVALLRASTD